MKAFIIASLAATAAPLSATPLDTAAIDRIVMKVLAEQQVPAASIAIVQDGKIVYAHAYGEQAPGRPAVPAARYEIASISKQFAATAILILADEGKLSLDDPVGKYVPGLTDGDHVTIRQVLSHTSGYRDYWPQDYAFADMRRPTTPQAILDRWAKAPLDFPPGTQWQYSNTGYVVAGRIIEIVSRETLMTFLNERIFKPLGMTSAVDADTGMTADDAAPHMRYALGPVRVEKRNAPGWTFATGELAMTASDLARWDIGVIEHKLLSPAAYAARQMPIKVAEGEDPQYGLGVQVYQYGGHISLEHEGEATGFLSHNMVVPDAKTAIVVLDNADFGNAQNKILFAIDEMLLPDFEAALKASPPAPPPPPPVAAPKTAATVTSFPDDRVRARGIYDLLRKGRIDRSVFTANANSYFTPDAVADYGASLGPLGEPQSFASRGSKMRGGFVIESFRVVYPDRSLNIVVDAEPGPHGKIEQFLVYPRS